MFLHLLNDDQKRTFFALAVRMILTDGIIRPEEVAYLNQLVEDSGIPGEISLSQSVETPDLSVFKSRASRLTAATELMIIAHVDERLHELESAMFRAVEQELHLKKSDLENIRLLAIDCAALFRAGRNIIAA